MFEDMSAPLSRRRLRGSKSSGDVYKCKSSGDVSEYLDVLASVRPYYLGVLVSVRPYYLGVLASVRPYYLGALVSVRPYYLDVLVSVRRLCPPIRPSLWSIMNLQ